MSSFTIRALDSAFGHPRGFLGQLGGALMARGNAATELQIVRLAHLRARDRVLVIGPGPGVGLLAAGEQAGYALGIEPSARMRQAATKRCAELIGTGRVEVREGSAEEIDMPDSSFDAVLTVNNLQLWCDRQVALAELYRVLRPSGLLLLSSHERWLPLSRMGLHAEVEATGFDEVQSWVWEPPTRNTSTAAQLRARCPTT